mgnify:CR=1 FL=1|tara:strand:- start:2437 stop:2688 length:252 start_codon:yes stop_codon:yes gene_type:complete
MTVNIKTLVNGQKIKFNDHWHTIGNNFIDCTNLTGTVCKEGQIIEIKLDTDKYKKDLFEWDNCLIFNFPDDDHYNDVEVEIKE